MRNILIAALFAFAAPLGLAQSVFNCSSGFNSSSSSPCGATINYGSQPFIGITSPGGTLVGSQFMLIPNPGGHTASTFMYQTPVNVQAFTSTFTFVPDGVNISFILNNTNNVPGYEGANFVGGAGCEGGFYQAYTPPEPNNVFALEFDSNNPLTASTSFVYSSTMYYSANQSPCLPWSGVNSDPAPNKISTSPVPLNSPAGTTGTTTGHTYSATISYDGSNLNLCLYDVTAANGSCSSGTSGTGTYFQQTWPGVNIPAIVGNSNTAYLGIAGGTNSNNSGPLYINSFSYTVNSPPPPPPADSPATINWTDVHQEIDGFGAANAFRTSDMTTAQQNFLFGTLGLSIMRVSVTDNGGAPGDCSSVGTSCAGPVVGDMQAMVAAGGKIYGSPWSPPPAYKTNNSVDCTTSPGNGALAFSSYGAYATWLANFVESLAAQSVPLYALSVQNEPDQCQGYDSAIWTSSQVDNFVKNNLGPTFASDSLSTLIFMPESGTYAQLTEGNGGGTCGTDSSCTVYVGGYNWHDYDATYSAPDSVNDTPYPSGWTSGKKYWETEAACLPGGPPWYPSFCAATSTSYTTSIADALQWAAVIDQRMAVDNANAWLYWLLYEPGEVDNEPLISDTTPYPQRAYMMGQYAHFVRPGMYRIDATHQPQSGVSVSAYQNTSANTLAIVATNYTGSAVAQTFNITNAPTFTSLTPTITSPTQSLATLSSVSLSGNGFTYTLPAQSITTFSGNSGAPTGSCPSGSPVAGNSKCYFIAANGSDSNNGTSESTPWLHAPGMPACSGICAAVQSSLGSGGTVQAGVGLIFRGGDTWHEGNSGATPYTGGSFNIIWSGGGPTVCQYEGTQTGCFYIGVDKNWFSGASWARPILTGDNEPSTTPVSSCSYQVPGSNQLFITSLNENSYIYLDSFEMTGMCFADTTPPSTDNTYIVDTGTGVAGQGMNLYNNVYIHGWSITTGTKVNSAIPCTLISGTFNGLQSFTQIVIDGSDSVPGGCSAGAYPSWYHLKDSIFRYTGEIAGQWCHDIHDTIWEHWFPPYYGESTGSGSWGNHPNTFECNADSSGNAPGQPANTPNVFYNNIIRHDDPSQAGAGAVHLWFCPTTIPEYWFNNLMYDVTGGNLWDYSGAPTYSCPYAGTGSGPAQYMFNNTLVDAMQPCYNTAYYYGSGPGDLINPLTVLNEHLVNTPFDSSSGTYANPACAGLASATNVAQTDASATAQAYTTGSSGTAGTGNTCANDSTKPCTPTANSNATVGAGGNEQTYCTYLAGFTSEAAIGTEAANACKYGTTDGCFYNSTTHSMSCPAQTAVTRPPSAAWDSGAYQFGSAPPGTPTASVSPSTLAFGSQTDSTTSGPLVVTIANTGTASLLFTGYGLTTGTQFAISANTCNSTYANSLPAGDSCTLSITFTPTSAGAKSDTLTLTNNSGGTAGTQQAVALSGTGISGPTWTYGTNVHNFSCSGSTAGTTITCAAVITLVSGQSLEGAVSAWNLNATATWNGISGDVALVHPLGCSATGTNAAKNFYSDLFYITSDAGATHTITVTLNSTASNWNMDLELVPVTISTGSAAFGGCGSVGYAASSPGCVSSPCVSPALTLSASSNAVLQAVALGYGPPATVPSVYTYDPDVGNVDAGFAWAPNLSAVTQITWDSTNAANYPAASVMALKPYTSPPAAPVHLTVVVSQ